MTRVDPIPILDERPAQGCTWLFGRGASIANGLPWVVPEEWKGDLLAGHVAREAHIEMIVDAIRAQMEKALEGNTPYRGLLDVMATKTIERGHHRLITTNWDYLLQRAVNGWVQDNQPGWAPKFISTHGTVLHFNGSAEPGDFLNRSPFMLETDSAGERKAAFEANHALELLLWSDLVIIVGMSFECHADRGLLAVLGEHQDNVPIGSACFIIVDPEDRTLESTYAQLAARFPRAGGMRVKSGLAEWVDSGMRELTGKIFTA